MPKEQGQWFDRKWILAACLLGLGIVFALAQSPWGNTAPKEVVVEIQLEGLACGSHLSFSPRHLDVTPGMTVKVINNSPWTQTLRVSTENSPSGNAVVESPRLHSGQSWTFELRQNGDYYLVSANPWYYLSGLQGEVAVRAAW